MRMRESEELSPMYLIKRTKEKEKEEKRGEERSEECT